MKVTSFLFPFLSFAAKAQKSAKYAALQGLLGVGGYRGKILHTTDKPLRTYSIETCKSVEFWLASSVKPFFPLKQLLTPEMECLRPATEFHTHNYTNYVVCQIQKYHFVTVNDIATNTQYCALKCDSTLHLCLLPFFD